MTVSNLVTDPSLIPLLQTSRATLKSAQQLIDLTSQAPQPPSKPESNPVNGDETTSASAEPGVAPPLDSHTRSLLLAQKQLNSQLSILRGQNRAAILDVRETKAQTAEARQEVDRLHLQLQNLLYEQRHLMGEIEACEGYDHAYTHLPLLPLEDYLTLFPSHASLPETELMPHRIQHEKSEREALEGERQQLLKKKAELVAENGRRKDDLKKLDEKMERFLEEAKGIMEVLEKEYE